MKYHMKYEVFVIRDCCQIGGYLALSGEMGMGGGSSGSARVVEGRTMMYLCVKGYEEWTNCLLTNLN